MEAGIINFASIIDQRGSLISLEGMINVPFPIKRIFYIYDVPFGAVRGGHIHKTCQQLLVAVNGSVLVKADNELHYLCRPDRGLYVPPGTMVRMSGFTHGCILMVLASEYYDPEDYAHDHVQRSEARTLVEA